MGNRVTYTVENMNVNNGFPLATQEPVWLQRDTDTCSDGNGEVVSEHMKVVDLTSWIVCPFLPLQSQLQDNAGNPEHCT